MGTLVPLFVFTKQFRKDLWSVCQTMCEEVFDTPPKPTSSEHTARFISPRKILQRAHTGFCLNGTHRLSQENSHKHALIVGPTGIGKSSTVLDPTIITTNGNFIIHDPSGQLYHHTAGYLKDKRGYVVKRLCFDRPNISDGFNPLHYVQDDSGVNKLADLIISVALGKDPRSSYWNESSIDLLAFLLRFVRTKKEVYHTLPALYRILPHIEATPSKFLQSVQETKDEALITHAQAFLSRDSKLRSSILTTVQAALQRYGDTKIALVSSFDSLDLHLLRKQKMAIYVQVPAAEHTYYTTPNSIFWEVLFSELMKELPEPGSIPVYCLIDEAGWLSLPHLSTVIAVARKYFGILLAVQDTAQLAAVHGKEGQAIIEANCLSKLYFTAQSPAAATNLMHALGTTEITTKEGEKLIRSLMNHSEIRLMNPFRAILLTHLGPMFVKLKPSYMNKELNRYVTYSRKHIPVRPSLFSKPWNHDA